MGDPESEEDAFKLICFVKYYMTVRSFSLFPLNISNCRYHHIWRTVKGLGLVATDVMLNTEKRIINHRIRSSFKKYCLLCRFSELFFIEIKKCIFIPLWIRSGHPRPLSADHPLQLLISLNIIRTVIPPSYHHIPFRQWHWCLINIYRNWNKNIFMIKVDFPSNIQLVWTFNLSLTFHFATISERKSLSFVSYNDLIMSRVWLGWLPNVVWLSAHTSKSL